MSGQPDPNDSHSRHMQQQPPAPFSCQYTPQVPELLMQLGCTLALSTYQAGKVVFLGPKNNDYLVQLPRTFPKAMGIALRGNQMAIACRDEVIVLADSPELAKYYPRQPDTYDALYMPRLTYHTGPVDIHDLDWGADGLYAVNTSFSCLIKIDAHYSFRPVWKPPFISRLASEDRCHLNGMAVRDEKPRYVTAFGTGDTPQSWRPTVTESGVIMDVETNEIIAEKLKMPHSPRWHNGKLYVLFSATGELMEVNVNDGSLTQIHQIKGFVRGLAFHKGYAFIGLSKLRKNSSTFAKLPVAEFADQAGIAIVHLETGSFVGMIKYLASVDEIYDVQVIPDRLRPGILNTMKDDHKLGLTTPDATYWAKPESSNQ